APARPAQTPAQTPPNQTSRQQSRGLRQTGSQIRPVRFDGPPDLLYRYLLTGYSLIRFSLTRFAWEPHFQVQQELDTPALRKSRHHIVTLRHPAITDARRAAHAPSRPRLPPASSKSAQSRPSAAGAHPPK